MSVLTRTRRPLHAYVAAPVTVPDQPVARMEAEAPERAVREPEAPESSPGRNAEAPDAGGGRADHCEHEFTHGRSQS